MKARSPVDCRAVITGLGVVACNGIGKKAFWETVVNGKSGVGVLTRTDTSGLSCKIGGEVKDKDFDPADYMDAREAKATARFVHFAVAAARLAMEDSGLKPGDVDPARMGAYFGTSTAGQGNLAEVAHEKYLRHGMRGIYPAVCVEVLPHAATARVFIELGLQGPNGTFAGGCAAALDVLEEARKIIANGQADVVIAGASDSCMNRYGLHLLCRLGVFASLKGEPHKSCCPYDKRHDGLVIGEGGAAVVVESARHAMDRGAHIYAEIAGHGSASEAKHMVAADPSGEELANAIRMAIRNAGIAPTDIDYMCAHGIGNPEYDGCDTNGLKIALGRHAYHIPVSSIKPVTAQPWTASGTFQAVTACMVIESGVIPPTMNLQEPDPMCDLDYVPLKARRARVDTVLMNGHSFGGTHTALVIRRFDDDTV